MKPLAIQRAAPTGPCRAAPDARPVHGLGLGPVLALVLAVLVLAVLVLAALLWVAHLADPRRPLATMLHLLWLAPLTEELVFRTGLQQQLLRAGLPPALAVLATAAAFALLHGVSRGAALGLAVLLPACALGLLYQRFLHQQRHRHPRLLHQRQAALPACVAAHAAMNLVWLLAGHRMAPALGLA